MYGSFTLTVTASFVAVEATGAFMMDNESSGTPLRRIEMPAFASFIDGVGVGVRDGVGVSVPERVYVPVCVIVPDELFVAVPDVVAVTDEVAVADGVREGEAPGVSAAVGDGVDDAVIELVGVPDSDDVEVVDAVPDTETEGVEETDGDGVEDHDGDGDEDGGMNVSEYVKEHVEAPLTPTTMHAAHAQHERDLQVYSRSTAVSRNVVPPPKYDTVVPDSVTSELTKVTPSSLGPTP